MLAQRLQKRINSYKQYRRLSRVRKERRISNLNCRFSYLQVLVNIVYTVNRNTDYNIKKSLIYRETNLVYLFHQPLI